MYSGDRAHIPKQSQCTDHTAGHTASRTHLSLCRLTDVCKSTPTSLFATMNELSLVYAIVGSARFVLYKMGSSLFQLKLPGVDVSKHYISAKYSMSIFGRKIDDHIRDDSNDRQNAHAYDLASSTSNS